MGFDSNTQLRFRLGQADGGMGRVVAFVETQNVDDGRLAAPAYPPVGLLLVPSVQPGESLQSLPEGRATHAQPQASDSVSLQASLPTGTAEHALIAYVAEPPPDGAQLALTIYSDVPLHPTEATAAAAVAEPTELDVCLCPKCNGKKSPFQLIYEQMARLEATVDERIEFLDRIIATAP